MRYDKNSAVGGLLRNHDVTVIMRFSNFFEHGKCSFDMECAALVSGLEKVIKLGLNNIAILSDPRRINFFIH
jgi:ribonuclease HI